jgi:hypothetical protein
LARDVLAKRVMGLALEIQTEAFFAGGSPVKAQLPEQDCGAWFGGAIPATAL